MRITEDYNPTDIYFNDWELKRVIDQLMDGTYANGDQRCIKICIILC